MNETDGKGTVSKVGYLFDSPASFRKLEIEPNALLNSHGQAAVRIIVYESKKIADSTFFGFSSSYNDRLCGRKPVGDR